MIILAQAQSQLRTQAAGAQEGAIDRPELRSLPTPLLRERADASTDYATANEYRFEGVTFPELQQDEALLNDVAEAVAVLASKIAGVPRSANYIQGRPSADELIDQACDMAFDALGPEAGRIVRAQARILGNRAGLLGRLAEDSAR